MIDLFANFDRFIRRDPAGRGLISSEAARGPLCAGHLALAGRELADRAAAVGIVTGFYIPHAAPPAAETDGPPGAALLAATLRELGIGVALITDPWGVAALRAASEAMDLPADIVLEAPARCDAWVDEFYSAGFGSRLSHLVAIERVGPSHTAETLASQPRGGRPVPLAEFERLVPVESRGHCHNMRANVIDDWTGDLHRLFERLRDFRPDARTIGVGDGGNEIGMGAIPWEELTARLDREKSERIPCRVSTDWTIVVGVSNWGAAALAAGVAALRNRVDVLEPWDCRQQEAALEELVRRGPAVDGVTGRAEATVDGLPFLTYIQPWRSIREALGLRP